MPCGRPLLGPANAGGNLIVRFGLAAATTSPHRIQFPCVEALAQREKPITHTAGSMAILAHKNWRCKITKGTFLCLVMDRFFKLPLARTYSDRKKRPRRN